LPDNIDRVFFGSSGSEVNAYASQLARLHTGNWSIMSLANGYHGHGAAHYLSNIGSYNIDIPKIGGVEQVPYPDMFRCPFPKDEASERYAKMVEDAINY